MINNVLRNAIGVDVVEPLHPKRKGVRRSVTELLYRLRTEAAEPPSQALSVGLGCFVGAFPVYGLHLPIVIGLSRVLRLNLITMFLATNLNNPILAPFFVYTELQIGRLARHGEFYSHSLATVRQLRLLDFAADVAIGAIVLGAVMGLVLGAVTYRVSSRAARDAEANLIIEETARRYLSAGYLQWEVARATLRLNRTLVDLVRSGVFPPEGTVVHVRCGRGTFLVMLDVITELGLHGTPNPGDPSESRRFVLRGVDDRRNMLRVARTAMGSEAAVVEADSADFEFPEPCSAVFLDALRHSGNQWRSILTRAINALGLHDVIVVHERKARSWRPCRSPSATPQQIADFIRSAGLETVSVDRIWSRPKSGFLIVARRVTDRTYA